MERDKFASTCSGLDVSNDIWRYLMENEVKLILELLVSESFSSRVQTKPFWGQRTRFNW